MGLFDKLFGKKEAAIEIIGDTRECYGCGGTINKNTGYLFQGVIPSFLMKFTGPVSGYSSKIGISCEHRGGDNPFAFWYWYCDKCGSEIKSHDTHNIFVNGSNHFWKTGSPPKRPPLVQGINA